MKQDAQGRYPKYFGQLIEGEQALYFGCANGLLGRSGAGHGFMSPDGGRPDLRSTAGRIPWEYEVDGGLAPCTLPRNLRSGRPGVPMLQGVAALHHKDGWTALSFWDRSGDTRGGSSSTILFDAIHDFDSAVAEARLAFPDLFKRINFEITEFKRP